MKVACIIAKHACSILLGLAIFAFCALALVGIISAIAWVGHAVGHPTRTAKLVFTVVLAVAWTVAVVAWMWTVGHSVLTKLGWVCK